MDSIYFIPIGIRRGPIASPNRPTGDPNRPTAKPNGPIKEINTALPLFQNLLIADLKKDNVDNNSLRNYRF